MTTNLLALNYSQKFISCTSPAELVRENNLACKCACELGATNVQIMKGKLGVTMQCHLSVISRVYLGISHACVVVEPPNMSFKTSYLRYTKSITHSHIILLSNNLLHSTHGFRGWWMHHFAVICYHFETKWRLLNWIKLNWMWFWSIRYVQQ